MREADPLRPLRSRPAALALALALLRPPRPGRRGQDASAAMYAASGEVEVHRESFESTSHGWTLTNGTARDCTTAHDGFCSLKRPHCSSNGEGRRTVNLDVRQGITRASILVRSTSLDANEGYFDIVFDNDLDTTQRAFIHGNTAHYWNLPIGALEYPEWWYQMTFEYWPGLQVIQLHVHDAVTGAHRGSSHHAQLGSEHSAITRLAIGGPEWCANPMHFDRVLVTREGAAPSAPRSVVAQRNGNLGELALSWSPPENPNLPAGHGISHYNVLRSTTSSGEYTHVGSVGWNAPDPHAFTDTGLDHGTTYWYRLVAVSVAGKSTPSTAISGTTYGLPTAPRSLAVEPAERGELRVSWATPSNDGGLPLTYVVSRGPTSTGPWDEVARTTSLSHLDAGFGDDETWHYAVLATNLVGDGPSALASGTTHRPAGPPQNLKALPAVDRVFLHWDAPADTGSTPITRYVIERTAPGQAPVYRDSTLGNATLHTEPVPGGVTYTYRVFAVNRAGPVHASAPATVTPFGAGGGSGGSWSNRTILDVQNATVVEGSKGEDRLTVHVYDTGSSMTCLDMSAAGTRVPVTCWSRGPLGGLDGRVPRGDTVVRDDVAGLAVSATSRYGFDAARLWHVVGVGGGAVDVFSPVGTADEEWWAAHGTETGLRLDVSVWSTAGEVHQQTVVVPYVGQALAAAEYSAGTA